MSTDGAAAGGQIFVLTSVGYGHLFPSIELSHHLSSRNYATTLVLPSNLLPSLPPSFHRNPLLRAASISLFRFGPPSPERDRANHQAGLDLSKWAFIVWLACRKRLATKDRLQVWGMDVQPSCVLCHQQLESHAHLFFDCRFSKYIWSDLLRRNLIFRSLGNWDAEIAWLSLHCTGTSLKASLCKLSIAAALYHIWLERNARIFTQKSYNPDDVISVIVANVKDRVCSWGKWPHSNENFSLCQNWNVSSSLLISRSRI